jgi:serine/threonine-protein kinase
MTETTDWSRIKELFSATFEAPPSARESTLLSEPNALIRQRVEAMLSAHDAAEGPLDRSVLLAVDSLDSSVVPASLRLLGQRLGPYQVLREIGRGGMGAVYEAVRADSQFEQRVAIKTLRIGNDSESVVNRFRQERRILAALQHPNIAALYDGAITEDGLPYFVLEYVDGTPIDTYCNERQLDVRARIELFLQVVAAVQYAHQQLVVHRDIKPNNILVTQDGVVKLLDFGIAKVLDTESSELTADLVAPLTLSYARPEQVKGGAITTASDVYSLGVVLYRLLAGANPLELQDLSLDRAVTTLCTVMPVPASDMVTADAAVSAGRVSVEKLSNTLRGDIDAILLTALRKEPERRYSTAREFGDDLSRYLHGRPVLAVPDSTLYRLQKFVRRQKALIAVSIIAIIAVTAGGITTLWQARLAKIEADRAQSVSSFLQTVIGAGNLSGTTNSPRLGPAASVSDLLDSAAARLPNEFRDDPKSSAEIHLALGRAFNTQQRWRDAERQYVLARDIAASLPDQPRVETAIALQGLAGIQLMSGGPLPKQLTMQSLQIFEKRGASRSIDYARSVRLYALIEALDGSYFQADTLLGHAVALYDSLDPRPSVEKALAIVDHAAVGEATGKPWSQSLRDYRRGLAMIDKVPGNLTEKADVLWYAARAEEIGGNRARADSLGNEALRVVESAAGPMSDGVAQQLTQLASISRGRGDTAKARQYVQRAMTILDSNRVVPALIRQRVQMEYARYHLSNGEVAAAESLAREVYRSRIAQGNWVYILDGANLYSDILIKEHKAAIADTVLRRAYSLADSAQASSYRKMFAVRLVQLYLTEGRANLAEPYLATLPDTVQQRLRAAPSSTRK